MMVFRLKWPTEFGLITQKFGVNAHNYKVFGLPGHEGIDIQAPTGSRVFAGADGVVSEVRLDGNNNRRAAPYGNQVRIRHVTAEGEFTTVYAHLHQVSVAVGANVSAGDQIGIADSTGNSTGAHLHLTLKKKGATAAHITAYPNDIVDPTPYLEPWMGGNGHGVPVVQTNDLDFVADVTVPDESQKLPGEQFEKVWRVKNTGTTAWGNGYQLRWFKDEQMGAPASVPLPAANPGDLVEVAVTLTAPNAPGLHRSTWIAADAAGKPFGSILFALIQVPDGHGGIRVNGILDLSHYNIVDSMQAAKDDGVVAIIHKATQGTGFVDAPYAQRRAEARQLGLLWGAYHFGDGSDPVQQAEHFLLNAQPDDKTLMALDFERNPFGASMSIAQAETFVTHIRNKTGRLPVIYTGAWYVRETLGVGGTTLLSSCPLWVAAYREAPILPEQWATWTLWQYTNGIDGPEPKDVAGISRCDRNQFNGTFDELKNFWGA